MQNLTDVQALLNVDINHIQAPTRRLALKTAVGVGYCATAWPVVAQTAIKTPSDGLIQGEVTIDVNGFKMPAFRSAPAGKTNLPLILVLSEVFGVHEYIADVTRRFALQGYIAIAPELFVRQGDPQSYGEIAMMFAEVIEKVPDVQVMNDLDACVAWAKSQGARVDQLGVTGFCWGGRQTLLYAAHNPSVKAAVAWYGRIHGKATPQSPTHPIDMVGKMQAPILGLYGSADTGIPVDHVNQLKNALMQSTTRAKQSQFVIYPDAPHAFHADYRPTYRQQPAQDGWLKALAWFKQHGVG